MRFAVPSVASEVQNALTARAQMPRGRSVADGDPRQAGTPFAEMLDNTATANEPPPAPRPSRADQPDRTDRSDAAPKTADNRADATNQPDRAAANDAANPIDKNAEGSAVAKDSTETKDSETAKPGADKTAEGKAPDGKAKPDAAKLAALEAMLGAVATPATPPQAPVATPIDLHLLAPATAQDGTAEKGSTDPETEALAALQGAGQQAAPAKPDQPAANGEHDAQAGAPKGATGDAKAVAQAEAGAEGQSHGKGEASGEFRHTLSTLLATADGNASAHASGDAQGTAKAATDAVQNLGVVTSQNTPAAAATSASTQAPASLEPDAVPLTGLAVEIATQASTGKNHFEIRLDPPELGRIDVRLDVGHDGSVTSHLTVDRADTLDLLKRDAGELQRALQQAGLKTADNALEFSLRQQGFSRDERPAQNTAHVIIPDDNPAPLEALRQGYGRLLGLGGGLDIRV